MLISLIIPVYNVELYIKNCLNSIVSQLPNSEVEVIIIDDGSPDRSYNIINEYLINLPDSIKRQFSLIRQENRGLSAARNTGIDNSKGEYLAFLDSDDMLYEGYFCNLISIIEKNKPDIIQFMADRFDDNSKKYSFYSEISEDGLYELDSESWERISAQSAWYAWMRIYHSSVFKNIRYPEGFNFEDIHTTPYLYMQAKNIYFLNKVILGYRFNPNSITHTKSKKNIDDLLSGILKMIKVLKFRNELSASVVAISQNYIKDVIEFYGFWGAFRYWHALKKELKNSSLDTRYLVNKGNKLFYYIGPFFFIVYKFYSLVKK